MAPPFWSPEWARRLESLERLVGKLANYIESSEGQDDLRQLLRRYVADYPDNSIEAQLASFRREYYDDKNRSPTYQLVTRLIARVEHIEEQRERLERSVDELSSILATEQSETHALLAVQALGLDMETTAVRRLVPIRAYLDEDDSRSLRDVIAAVEAVLASLGFGVADDLPPVRGSWYKRWFARSRDALTRPEVVERLEKIERAVELRYVEQPQSSVDEKQASAIAKLIKALDKTPNAALQAGSVLVVKLSTNTGPMIQARTLNQRELAELENNQRLLKSPSTILEKLAIACSDDASARKPGKRRTPPASSARKSEQPPDAKQGDDA